MAVITCNDDPRSEPLSGREEISSVQILHKSNASERERKINEHIKAGKGKFQHREFTEDELAKGKKKNGCRNSRCHTKANNTQGST